MHLRFVRNTVTTSMSARHRTPYMEGARLLPCTVPTEKRGVSLPAYALDCSTPFLPSSSRVVEDLKTTALELDRFAAACTRPRVGKPPTPTVGNVSCSSRTRSSMGIA